MSDYSTSSNDSPVEWKDIPGFDGTYQVSNTGLVRRSSPGSRTAVGKVLSPGTSYQGYLFVNLTFKKTRSYQRVHRLVMLAFVGACPEAMEINHIDGNKANNHLGNLEYVTHQENMNHYWANRGINRRRVEQPKRPSCLKLDAEKVKEIRSLSTSGIAGQEIAMRLNVHKSTISRVLSRKIYKDVE